MSYEEIRTVLEGLAIIFIAVVPPSLYLYSVLRKPKKWRIEGKVRKQRGSG